MSNLTLIRKGLGLTQAAMARVIDVTPGMVSQYENGLVDFPPSKARRLRDHAASLGQVVTFDDIYSDPQSTAAA